MIIRIIVDKKTLDKIDLTAQQLTFKTKDTEIIINMFCEVILQLKDELIELMDIIQVKDNPILREIENRLVSMNRKYFINYEMNRAV